MQHTHRVAWFALLAALLTVGRLLAAAPPAFTPAAKFAEQEHWETVDPGVRVYVNAPLERVGDDVGPTRLIFFALPNGNTIEQTLGCRMKSGLDCISTSSTSPRRRGCCGN